MMEYVWSTIDFLVMYLFALCFFKPRRRIGKRIDFIILIVVAVMASFINDYFANSDINLVVTIIFIVVVLGFFEGNWKRKLFVGSSFFAFIITIEGIVALSIGYFFHIEASEMPKLDSDQKKRIDQLLANEPVTAESTYDDIVKTLPALYDKAVTNTRLSLDKNSMKRISQVLQKAECIDIYGTGISYILAQSAAFKISTLGLECSAYESINSHYLAARKHKKNIAFLISLTGSNHTVICMAKYLREATETYVVGIAGPYHTELKKWCHEIVEIPNRDALLSLDVITSFSGATYILDIFFALLLSKRYEEHARSSMEMLNHLSLLWDETYHTKEKNE